MSIFGERLGQALQTCRLSKVDFAKKVGVSRKQVYKWLIGRDVPSNDKLPLICSALGLDPFRFLTGHEPKSDEENRLAESMQDPEFMKLAESFRQARLLPNETFEVRAKREPYRTLLRLVLTLDDGRAEKLCAFIFPDRHQEQIDFQDALPELDALFAKLKAKKGRRK